LVRVSFKLSLRNAIINTRARQLQQTDAAPESQPSKAHEAEAAFSPASRPIPAASDSTVAGAPAPIASIGARSVLSHPINAAASTAIDETDGERLPHTVFATVFSPMKRLVRRMRSILLTPLHAQLDGLQMLIYALHEKVDDAQSAYSLHEKLDAAQ